MRLFFRALILVISTLLIHSPSFAQHALRFSSGDADRVTFTSTTIGSGSFTYEAWVNYAAPAYLGSYNTLFELGNDERTLYVRRDGKLEMYGGSTTVSSNGPVDVQGWHHVACTYNDATTQCFIYIDGLQAGTALASFPTSTQTEMGIGYHSGDTGWQGELDEALVWNSARTQAQILTDMRGVVVGNEPTLIGYFKFDEGVGQVTANRKAGSPPAALGETTGTESSDPQWNNANILTAPADLGAAPGASLILYPNPATTTTAHLTYTLPEFAAVQLVVLDATGREVATLVDGPQAPGAHTAELSKTGLPTGVYVCRLRTAVGTTTQRLVLTQ